MSTDAVLSGDLNFLSLGDLLQLLGTNGSSGVLRIVSRYADKPGIIYFSNGNPMDAECLSKSGLEALYALFGWTEGQFEFLKDNVTRKNVINKSRMEITLDGLRMLDDGQIQKLGPVSFEIKPNDSASGGMQLPIIKGPLVDYMYVVDEEEFSDAYKIIEEGKHGNWIWVLLEGVVDIVRETPQGTLNILRVGDGAFIGSLASFLIQGNIRSATALSVGNVHLGVLDSQRLSREWATMNPEFRKLLTSLDKRLKEVTNRTVELYFKKNRASEFVKGKKMVIKQGKPEDRVFTIAQGNAFIIKETEDGYVPLIKLEEGDFLGKLPFIDFGQEPNSASVLASQDFKVSPIDVDKFQKEYDQLSNTFRNLIDYTASCITATTLLATEYQKLMNKESTN